MARARSFPRPILLVFAAAAALGSGALAAFDAAVARAAGPTTLVGPAADPTIKAADALAHVKVLASEDFEGRGVLTEGLRKAGEYIAGRMQGAQLTPAGDRGSFFQAVDVRVPGQFGEHTMFRAGGQAFELRKDLSPNGGTLFSQVSAGLAFAGYGITIPGGYDDYAGLDARGRVVLVLRYAPRYDLKAGQGGSPADPAFRAPAGLAAKVENAVKHGATGIIIVDPPAQGTGSAGPLPIGIGGPDIIGSWHASQAAADRLLAPAGKTVAALQKSIDESGKPASLAVPTQVEFALERASSPSRNVVGIVEGSDPMLRDEAILIGAHYDHLGHGDEGGTLDGKAGALHPGADDNASGTSAVLELVDAFATATPRPRRSVIFVLFTGEEKGLIGSAWNARHLPHKKVVAMLNLDMVGRLGGKLEVGGTATAPDLRAIVEAANEEKLPLDLPAGVVPNSDHASYLQKGIPSLFFFTGLHPDYHRATDTWDKVNPEGIAQAARLAYRVARVVADRPAVLAFVPPKWTSLGGRGGGAGGGVRLGIAPADYSGSEKGVRIGSVLESSPAAAAGLQRDDLIVEIAGKPVADMDRYMEILGAMKPGSETTVGVVRGNDHLTLKVKFAPKE